MDDNQHHYLPISGTLLATAFLAFGSVLIRWSEVDGYATSLFRGVFAVLFFVPIVLLFQKKSRRKNFLVPNLRNPVIMIAGFFLGLEVMLFAVGVQFTTIANANLLINLAPFIVIALTSIISRTVPSKRFLVGLSCTVLGLALLLGRKFSLNPDDLWGDILCTIAAVGFAIYLFTIARYTKKQDAFYVMYQTSWGFIAICLVAMFLLNDNGQYHPVTSSGWIILIVFTITTQIIGHGLVIFSMARLHTNLAVALLLAQPVAAAVYGYLLFGETLTISEMIGMFVVMAGIYIVQYKVPKHVL